MRDSQELGQGKSVYRRGEMFGMQKSSSKRGSSTNKKCSVGFQDSLPQTHQIASLCIVFERKRQISILKINGLTVSKPSSSKIHKCKVCQKVFKSLRILRVHQRKSTHDNRKRKTKLSSNENAVVEAETPTTQAKKWSIFFQSKKIVKTFS